MSDLKVDGVIASTGTNTNLTLQGKGSGKVAIGDGALLFPDADGSANQVIETNASGVLSFVTPSAGGFTLGTEQATTSGTSWTFGSIPAGTTMITINVVGLSFSASDLAMLIQIGDSGGIESSGYSALGWGVWDTALTGQLFTSSFAVATTSGAGGSLQAGYAYHGIITLVLEDAANFTWTMTGGLGSGTLTYWHGGYGSKSLSAELTQLKISGGTGDAGAINIMYQ